MKQQKPLTQRAAFLLADAHEKYFAQGATNGKNEGDF